MSIDSFVGFDSADGGISPEQAREYQARMARNAKHMAAARKQEKKQKKKEDRLFMILLKFIRDNKRNDITLLVSRCLEQNIPAVFILAILMLDNEELQKEFGIQFELLEGAESSSEQNDPSAPPPAPAQLESSENTTPLPNALVAFGDNHAFPLEMRIALDLWTKSIWDAVSPLPEKIFKTAVEFNENPKAEPESKEVVIQLTAFVLRDYFTDHGNEQVFENIKSFADFFMKGLLKRLKEQMKDQVQLEGEQY